MKSPLAACVIDTSYLRMIAGCEPDKDRAAIEEVRRRLAKSQKTGLRFFVPLPCLFELGNHIAFVKHKERRQKLATWLVATVDSCLKNQTPWFITPTGTPETILPELVQRFAQQGVVQKIGLVDCFTWQEALRLKQSYARVQIWTNDRALKAREPDPEPDPYLW